MGLRRLPGPDFASIRNAVVLGIPFLLMAAKFAELAVVDATLPAIGAPTASASSVADPTFDLAVRVARDGYEVVGVASAAIPCARGRCATAADYDIAALTHVLRGVKRAHPDQDRIVLVPEGDVAYDVLLVTMGAAREDRGAPLFPNVVLSGAAP